MGAKIDPEDILQSSFQAFFQKADRNEIFWNKEGDLWRLLAAICMNHIKREFEHFSVAKRDLAVESQIPVEFEPGLNQASRKLDELIESLLNNESPLSAKVVLGRLAGFSFKDIAKQTERSERTIRRVLQMLKAKLAIMSDLALESHLVNGQVGARSELPAQFNASYDDFDLLRMLDAGAFGKVYLAKNRRTDLLVAVKALRRAWIGDFKAESLFLNEAKTLSAIEHPNIIKFLDAGPLPNGSWFLVLEYVDGTPLDRQLSNPADLANLLTWLKQICAGLVEIHKHGLTHGDLKPANVIVCSDGVRIIDFGFSVQAVDSRRPLSGGTVGYMAPECESSPAADVFALGKMVKFAIGHILEQMKNHQWLAELTKLSIAACNTNPNRRPSAVDLRSNFEDLIERFQQHVD